jgi:hypothetical protein
MDLGSENRAWEHYWQLNNDGIMTMQPLIRQNKLKNISTAMFDEAIYTPVNKGAWFFINFGDYAIMGYHATSVVGGNIPKELLLHHVVNGLDKLLMDIEVRAHTALIVGSHQLHVDVARNKEWPQNLPL